MHCVIKFIASGVFSNLVLFGTLIAAIRIGTKQNKINQDQNEANFRPVILRDNFINSWKDIDIEKGLNNGNPIIFENQKNIAQQIRGYIILNYKKYDLLFGIGVKEDSKINYDLNKIVYPTIGWIKEGGMLCAKFDSKSFKEITTPNEIFITYQDINGNSYYTKEDLSFFVTSGKLN